MSAANSVPVLPFRSHVRSSPPRISDGAHSDLLENGTLVADIIPEPWILNRYSSHIDAPVLTRSDEQVTVLSRIE